MFLNPRDIIKAGVFSIPSMDEEQVIAKYMQPNAIDFPIQKLFCLSDMSTFTISEKQREPRSRWEIQPDSDGFFTLERGHTYEFESSAYVDLTKYPALQSAIASEVIVRSSLNRSGVFITAGLYDTGFAGYLGGVIHNPAGTTRIAVGTRIGQIKFISSDNAGEYAGGYNQPK